MGYPGGGQRAKATMALKNSLKVDGFKFPALSRGSAVNYHGLMWRMTAQSRRNAETSEIVAGSGTGRRASASEMPSIEI